MKEYTERARRWRLILGKHAERRLNVQRWSVSDREVDEAMTLLYSDGSLGGGASHGDRTGGRESSVFRTIDWLGRADALFPEDVLEKVKERAVERFGLEAFLNHPGKGARLVPGRNIVKTLLTFRGRIGSQHADRVRSIIQEVIDRLVRQLQPVFEQAFSGRRTRTGANGPQSHRNFDYRETIRRNMKHYDPQLGRIIPRRIRFHSRLRRKREKTVLLVVDQSGSMADSVLFSAVIAGVLTGFPNLTVRLILFDTQVADLTHLCDDPVSVLMSVQLGGGTNIEQALGYTETKIVQPKNTVVIVVSDFFEGGSPGALVNRVHRIREGGARLLGVTALDGASTPFYDTAMAARLKAVGMDVVSVSPSKLADWLASELS